MTTKELMKEKRPQLFWTCCVAHMVNLMFGGISNCPYFRELLRRPKSWLFSSTIILKHSLWCTLSQIRRLRDQIPTRFATNFLTLQSLYEKKGQLRFMFSDERWTKKCKHSKTVKGKWIEGKAVSESFWTVCVNFWTCMNLCTFFWGLLILTITLNGICPGMLEEVKDHIRKTYKSREWL